MPPLEALHWLSPDEQGLAVSKHVYERCRIKVIVVCAPFVQRTQRNRE